MATPRIIPTIINWIGLDPTKDLIRGVTPAPKLENLLYLNSKVQAACTAPYAMTGLAMYLEMTTGQKVLAQQRVNVATHHMRPVVARGDGSSKSGPTDKTSILATSSGSSGADEIQIPSPFGAGSEAWPPNTGSVTVCGSAEIFDPTPLAAEDRFMESPTITSLTLPVTEKMEVTRGLGITVIPTMVADLSTL